VDWTRRHLSNLNETAARRTHSRVTEPALAAVDINYVTEKEDLSVSRLHQLMLEPHGAAQVRNFRIGEKVQASFR